MATLAALALGSCVGMAAAPAAAQVQPYGTNDYGGFLNILPPGQGQTLNGAEVAQAMGSGTPRPSTTTSARCTATSSTTPPA